MHHRPTGDARGGVDFFFFNYCDCKAKAILIWGVRFEFLRGKHYFLVSPPSTHIHFVWGGLLCVDSLLSKAWICAGSAKEAPWIGALCCILPEGFGWLGSSGDSFPWAFQKDSIQSGWGKFSFLLPNSSVGDGAGWNTT